jgi:hypothetical protein
MIVNLCWFKNRFFVTAAGSGIGANALSLTVNNSNPILSTQQNRFTSTAAFSLIVVPVPDSTSTLSCFSPTNVNIAPDVINYGMGMPLTNSTMACLFRPLFAQSMIYASANASLRLSSFVPQVAAVSGQTTLISQPNILYSSLVTSLSTYAKVWSADSSETTLNGNLGFWIIIKTSTSSENVTVTMKMAGSGSSVIAPVIGTTIIPDTSSSITAPVSAKTGSTFICNVPSHSIVFLFLLVAFFYNLIFFCRYRP